MLPSRAARCRRRPRGTRCRHAAEVRPKTKRFRDAEVTRLFGIPGRLLALSSDESRVQRIARHDATRARHSSGEALTNSSRDVVAISSSEALGFSSCDAFTEVEPSSMMNHLYHGVFLLDVLRSRRRFASGGLEKDIHASERSHARSHEHHATISLSRSQRVPQTREIRQANSMGSDETANIFSHMISPIFFEGLACRPLSRSVRGLREGTRTPLDLTASARSSAVVPSRSTSASACFSRPRLRAAFGLELSPEPIIVGEWVADHHRE